MSALPIVVASLVLGGCGARNEAADETGAVTTTPERSPTTEGSGTTSTVTAAGPVDTLKRFLAAADAGDAEGMWRLLSDSARQSFGPTETEFAARQAHAFEEGAGTWNKADYKVLLDERVSSWALVAIAGTRTVEGVRSYDTYAVLLKREGGEWKLDLGRPPRILEFEPSPPPEWSGPQPRILARYESEAPAQEVRLWLDGKEIRVEERRDGQRLTVTARPLRPLAPGPHAVVAFVRSGDDASTAGWAFKVSEAR